MRFELALIVMRPQDLRGRSRNPRPASPGSTTEVETSHPLLSCDTTVTDQCHRVEQRVRRTYARNRAELPASLANRGGSCLASAGLGLGSQRLLTVTDFGFDLNS